MKKLVPLAMLLAGSGAGVMAGLYFRPIDPAQAATSEINIDSDIAESNDEVLRRSDNEYVKLPNQFVIPIIKDDRVSSMVVMTLSIEIASGKSQVVYDKEPKLRDVFLRVLFDHATLGGFSGTLIDNDNLDGLRRSLLSVAQQAIGETIVTDILIFEIARQDY